MHQGQWRGRMAPGAHGTPQQFAGRTPCLRPYRGAILARHSSATLVQRHAAAWPGAWQVLNVLIAVNDLASGRMEYSLEVNLVLVSDA